MPKLTVYNIEGKEVGSMDLPSFFEKDVNQDVVHQAVVMYQANQRQGNADTKVRSEISGGGKKPFRQKGTGRARQGSSRSPLMHHGGIVFGPQPRDFSYTLPKKIKVLALKEALKIKYKEGSLICVDEIAIASGKTKDCLAIFKNLKLAGKKIVGVFDGADDMVTRASQNIQRFNRVRSIDINALDIIKNNKVLATKTAMEQLLKRLS